MIWIPIVISLFFLCVMLSPSKDNYNDPLGLGKAFDCIFSLFWIIPILLVWVIYLGIMLWIK